MTIQSIQVRISRNSESQGELLTLIEEIAKFDNGGKHLARSITTGEDCYFHTWTIRESQTVWNTVVDDADEDLL